MEMSNPIVSSSGKATVPLNGTYEGMLTAFAPCEKRKFQSEEKEKALKWTFDIYTDNGLVSVNRITSVSNNEKSSLVKFIKPLAGTQFNENVRRDRDQLWALMKSLVGKMYLISVEHSETGYNNIVSAMPAPNRPVTTQINNGVSSVVNAADDDDIPF